MSHVAKIQIEIKDMAALRAACKRLGLTFVEGQKRYAWYGRHVGDYPLPDGFTTEDMGKCEHAIKVPGASYEIGVCARRDGKSGVTLLWDFWGSGGLEKQLGKNGQRLIQAYGVEAAKLAARRQGFSVSESVKADGSIALRINAAGRT